MSRHTHNAIIQMLAIDQKTGNYSNLKVWQNIGHGILCAAFIHQVWNGTASTELYLTFGALVAGSRILSKYLAQKKDNTDVSISNSKED